MTPQLHNVTYNPVLSKRPWPLHNVTDTFVLSKSSRITSLNALCFDIDPHVIPARDGPHDERLPLQRNDGTGDDIAQGQAGGPQDLSVGVPVFFGIAARVA